MEKKRNHSFFLQILRPYRGRIAFLSVCTVLQSVLQVGLALLTRFVIDSAVKGTPDFGMWTALLVADLLLQVCLHALLTWRLNSTMDRFVASLRYRLLKSAAYSADSRLQEFHSGALVSRGMEDVRTVCDGLINAFPSFIGQVTRLIAAFGAVLVLSPPIAGVLAAAAVLVVGAISVIRPVLRSRQREVREADEKIMSTMQEDLQKLELIQSIQSQEQILERFDGHLSDGLKAKFKRRIFTVGSNSVLNVASLLGTGVLLLWGATQVAAGVLSYGSLTSMLQLLSQFRMPVLSLSGLWTRFAAVEVAGERLAQLMEIPEQETAREDLQPVAVVFENVTFRYPGDDAAVVENFSLRLPLDTWSSLGGISGQGKTTLFKLILGLYTPQEGRIYLETEQGNVPCGVATRHLFAYVPQDYALFSGTVLENLLLVAPCADPVRRRDALALACADFVYELTDGENTHVGENNTGLSKGQLQRLAIARAVLMERRILLLDECTSALDGETEQAVLRNLHSLCPCAILVTHRPEALEQISGVKPILMEE